MAAILEASLAERARRLGIVAYEGRLIHGAQPGITDATIVEIERHCRGPLPDGLKALWRCSFGGSIDYDLEATFGDSVVEFSFTELFYPGSEGYRDLWGWIEHEAELAERAAERDRRKFDGRLNYLPFGGFEHADRLYVCVEPGPDFGSVHAWMQGLPPGWVLRLNEDRVSRIADDIPSLFKLLDLASDPFNEGGEQFAMGEQLAAIIEEVSNDDLPLADALRSIVRGAVVDWRGALASGTIAGNPRLRRVAMRNAITRDDRELLSELEAAKCSFDEPLRATGNALDLALALGKVELAELFLAKGVSALNAVRNGAHKAPAGLVLRLLKAGSRADGFAARSAALAGLHESAVLIASALTREERSKLIRDLDPDKSQAKWKAIEMLRDACLAMDRRRQ
ncbi:MAG: SMI1/KNR4 family protein [Hyphomonadaceae bacterium]